MPKLFYSLLNLILIAGLYADSMKPLFQFTGERPSDPWIATNDGVMGGLSQGGAQLEDLGMRFSGVLSLENNGGFSSVYASGSYDLSDYDGIRMSVMGDGRTYQLRFNTDVMYRKWSPVSFASDFSTRDGEWIEIFVSFDELRQSWRGRQLSGYLFNKANIRRIGFMLADKQPGEFQMKVRWLGADKASVQ